VSERGSCNLTKVTSPLILSASFAELDDASRAHEQPGEKPVLHLP
jgi:hypothetical protein